MQAVQVYNKSIIGDEHDKFQKRRQAGPVLFVGMERDLGVLHGQASDE
jgi:hypothetical protein